MFCLVWFTSVDVSRKYAERYKMPKNIQAEVDLSGADTNAVRAINLYGEWEFYYNKWIVTDEYLGESDGKINLPQMWTGIEVGGKKLPKEGYASYKITLKNVPEDLLLSASLYSNENAYRIFANGQIIKWQGTMSKETNAGRLDNNKFDEKIDIKKGETIEVVVEISANNLGGLLDSPNIQLNASKNSFGSWIFSMPTVGFGIMVALVVISFVMCLSVFKENKDFSLFMLLTSLLIYYCYVKDGFFIFIGFTKPHASTIYIGNIIATGMINIAGLYYLKRNNLAKMKYPQFGILSGIFVVCAGVQLGLLGTMFQLIPIAINIAVAVYILFITMLNINKSNLFDGMAGAVMQSVVILLQAFIMLDNMAFTVQGMETYPFIGTMIIIILLSVVYLYKMRKNARMAVKALELSREISDIKNEALRSQIKPHFVFNTLTSIQHLYHDSLALGDEGLTRFSEHLRLNVDADINGMISFEREIDNILNYFELENMRLDNKLCLLFDIEYLNFEVPILTLQPLIENAVKYSGVQNKENGYIQIKCYKEKNEIIISVIDNGKGFDINNVRLNAKGLKNIVERLKYALGASVEISSVMGKGTSITIKIIQNAPQGEDK